MCVLGSGGLTFVAESSLVSVSHQLGSRYQNPSLVFGPGMLQSCPPVALGRGSPVNRDVFMWTLPEVRPGERLWRLTAGKGWAC